MATSEIAKLESRWRENPHGLTFAPLAEAYRKQKDPRRALDILQPGLQRHPDYIPANIVLGRCHWDLGDLEAAEKAFTHVLVLDGENVIALKALADISERHSRPGEAERWLEMLLSVDRSNEEARDQLARIRAVQSMSPPLETPAGLAAPAGADGVDGVPAEPAEVVGSAPLDPFPAIVDQMPPAEARGGEDADAGWVGGASDVPGFEPATFPDLLDPGTAAEPSVAEPVGEPVASREPSPGVDRPSFATPPFPDPDAFRFERAEEIVLDVSSRTEFQAPSAADELVASRRDTDRDTEEVAGDPFRDDELGPPAGFQAEELEVEQEPVPATSLLASEPPPPAALFASYLPDETAGGAEAPGYEPAGYEPPRATDAGEALPRDERAAAAAKSRQSDGPDVAEPDLVVTETMAQVFLRQGHIIEALAVYRELLARSPDSPRLGERVAELEERQRVLSAPPLRPSVRARDTGGQSLGSFFAAILGAKPELATLKADEDTGGVELNPETAPATRPAEEPLSLGSVFGEDPPSVAPAVPPAGAAATEPSAESGDSVSFDDFFAGAQVPAPAPAPPARPVRGARSDDDLDQFHTWLQGLKR